MEPDQDARTEAETDPLLEEQEGKGYGAEEGEREQALDDSSSDDE